MIIYNVKNLIIIRYAFIYIFAILICFFLYIFVNLYQKVTPPAGIEPATVRLPGDSSTDWATEAVGRLRLTRGFIPSRLHTVMSRF